MNEDSLGAVEFLEHIDRIIHEPARFLIMAALMVVRRCDFLFLLNQTGLTRGNLSAHLSKLEEAGYVAIEKTFVDRTPRTLIAVSGEGRKAFRLYQDRMRQALDRVPE